MSYKAIQVNEDNYGDLIPIFKSAFNSEPTVDEIARKQDTSFSGAKDIGFLAYSEKNEPSGYYAVFPLKLKIGKDVFLGCQSGDTMVHKDHQRRGLFTLLAKSTYELCIKSKISGVFGFPSESSYHGFVKNLEWKHSENIIKYRFIIFTLPISELVNKFKVFNKAYLSIVNFCISRFKTGDFFPGSILSNAQDGVYRDKGFWDYKFRNKDLRVIKICKADIILKCPRQLCIGDINYSSIEQLNGILLRLKLFCFFLGINRIDFMVSPGTKLSNDLSNFKKGIDGLPIAFREFDASVDFSSLKFVYFDFDTF